MLDKLRIIRLGAVVLACAAPAFAQDKVLGLLRLPEVFGNGPCAPFEPRAVPLYADAEGARAAGTIEVDRNWSFAPHGGCEGLEVSVHRGGSRDALATKEYDYEAPAAIVLEQRGLAFRIRVGRGETAWVHAPAANRFLPYESLLEEFVGVTFINDGFAGGLVRAPGERATAIGAQVKAGQPVRVIEHRRSGDALWLHVEVLNHSVCQAADEGPPETIASGWLPAHMASGEPIVWFSSRGC